MVEEKPRRAGRGGRERVLAAAADLFARQGITGTTMEQVAAAAPVSKRTLYLHFPVKDDLVVAYLRELVRSGDTLHDVLTRADLPARQRLLAMFDLPDAEPVRGCLFVDAAAEYPDPASAVHAYAREQKLLMLRLVTDLVSELGAADPAALAEQLVTLADGAASRAMVLGDPSYGRHARAAAEVLLERAVG
ncbi:MULTISPECIES: TetR/AcrR family transcriptional regulator [unclassified Amycolatopsis]|uniref:TetR/AcrR family transcriptional regulator n=1 Tax=unclassified Amycolatopsis TaxID=2618356 RepID=UPI001EE86C3D|nr:TetR family transcriptional regulator [Amycolatopsis sp. Poz14]MCG3755164.1 TetR family transcriptional regulator [Amycolatopsis sp. Poz14]